MRYSEKIAVYSQIHTKHINTLCGQNVELLNVKLVVHIVTKHLAVPTPSLFCRLVVFRSRIHVSRRTLQFRPSSCV